MTTTVTDAIAVIKAAKDRGDPKGDKDRKGTLLTLVRKATALQSLLPVGGEDDVYPEVREALTTVTELVDVSSRLDQQAEALKRAPSGTLESDDAQMAIDKSRKNIDSMLVPLEAIVSTLETLVEATMEMEATYKEALNKVVSVKETLAVEKGRLASVARAVQNAAKLG